MARHGATKSQKRISASKAVNIARKEFTWTIRARPGPHSGRASVPLGIAIRDLLGMARNLREAKIILNKRIVSVDGVIRTSTKLPIGLFDVIAFSTLKKQYRVLIDKKSRFFMKAIPAKNSGFKLVKVTGKHSLNGKQLQANTNDGRSFMIDAKKKLAVGTSLKISLPEQKISETFELAKGNLAFVFTGKRIGAIVEIKEVLPGTMRRGKLVVLKPKTGKEFQTVADNVFVVGKQKPEVEIE